MIVRSGFAAGVAATEDWAKATAEALATRKLPIPIPRIHRESRMNRLFIFNQLSEKLANPKLCCFERTTTGSRDPVKTPDTLAGPLLLGL